MPIILAMLVGAGAVAGGIWLGNRHNQEAIHRAGRQLNGEGAPGPRRRATMYPPVPPQDLYPRPVPGPRRRDQMQFGDPNFGGPRRNPPDGRRHPEDLPPQYLPPPPPEWQPPPRGVVPQVPFEHPSGVGRNNPKRFNR